MNGLLLPKNFPRHIWINYLSLPLTIFLMFGDYIYTLRFGPKLTLCRPCKVKFFVICEAFAFYLCDTNIAQSRKRKKHKQDILENRQCFEIILNVAAATEENCLSTIW